MEAGNVTREDRNTAARHPEQASGGQADAAGQEDRHHPERAHPPCHRHVFPGAGLGREARVSYGVIRNNSFFPPNSPAVGLSRLTPLYPPHIHPPINRHINEVTPVSNGKTRITHLEVRRVQNGFIVLAMNYADAGNSAYYNPTPQICSTYVARDEEEV